VKEIPLQFVLCVDFLYKHEDSAMRAVLTNAT